MRKLIGCTLLIALLAAAGSYAWWTTQRDVGHYLSDLRIELAINDGVNNDVATCWASNPICHHGIIKAWHWFTSSSRRTSTAPATPA
jgi:hypothetical protein